MAFPRTAECVSNCVLHWQTRAGTLAVPNNIGVPALFARGATKCRSKPVCRHICNQPVRPTAQTQIVRIAKSCGRPKNNSGTVNAFPLRARAFENCSSEKTAGMADLNEITELVREAQQLQKEAKAMREKSDKLIARAAELTKRIAEAPTPEQTKKVK